MNNQSLYWVDKARVWASFAVVVIHINALFLNIYSQEIPAFWAFSNFTGSLVRWSVPLFVMLSGFLLLSSQSQSLRDFLNKKMKRILFPLIGWSAIYYLYFFFRAKYLNGSPLVLSNVVNNFLLGKPYYHLYFLFLIFGLYLATPILKVFIQNASQNLIKYFVFFSLSVVVIPVFLDYFLPNKWFGAIVLGNDSMFNFFIQYLGYFLAGFYIANYTRITTYNVIRVWIILFFSILVTMIGTYIYHDTGYFYSYLSINVMLMSLAVYYLFFYYKNPTSFTFEKIIRFIAPNTLGIYLIHPIIFELFPNIHQLSFKVGPLIGTLIISVIVYLISLILVIIARRIPVVRNIV